MSTPYGTSVADGQHIVWSITSEKGATRRRRVAPIFCNSKAPARFRVGRRATYPERTGFGPGAGPTPFLHFIYIISAKSVTKVSHVAWFRIFKLKYIEKSTLVGLKFTTYQGQNGCCGGKVRWMLGTLFVPSVRWGERKRRSVSGFLSKGR
jgi:hypothetical protein